MVVQLNLSVCDFFFFLARALCENNSKLELMLWFETVLLAQLPL